MWGCCLQAGGCACTQDEGGTGACHRPGRSHYLNRFSLQLCTKKHPAFTFRLTSFSICPAAVMSGAGEGASAAAAASVPALAAPGLTGRGPTGRLLAPFLARRGHTANKPRPRGPAIGRWNKGRSRYIGPGWRDTPHPCWRCGSDRGGPEVIGPCGGQGPRPEQRQADPQCAAARVSRGHHHGTAAAEGRHSLTYLAAHVDKPHAQRVPQPKTRLYSVVRTSSRPRASLMVS
jgi:hypothetical protein